MARYADERQLQDFLLELIVSLAVIGAGVGAALGGWLSDVIGRKRVRAVLPQSCSIA